MKLKLLLPTVFIVLSAQPFNAQTGYDYFDANNVEALISPVANHFWDYNWNHYYVPKNDLTSSIFTSTIWIGGLDSANQLHLAAERFRGTGYDYTPGPIGDSGSYSPPSNGVWDRVWKVNKAEIEAWLLDPQNISPPQSVIDWPAHGDVNLGQAANLAPFIDVNGDGQYNPLSDLDYPAIKGDQAVYFIFNDDAAVHTESGGDILGVEIHGMAYGFDCPEDTALNHALFMEYTILNRSTNDYHDLYLGSWTDFDLGNAQDDFVGSDPLRNLVFAYNGDALDEDAGWQTGYQNNLPAQGIRLLNGLRMQNDAMDNLPSASCGGNYNGFGMNDGVVDNERLGMHSFRYHRNSSQPDGDPQIAQDYYNFMIGNWKDGVPMTYGGNGYDPNNPLAIECKFMYPDSPDSLFIGTGGVVTPYWDEVSGGVPSGDRRGVFSVGPIKLDAGASNSFEMVYVFAQKMNDRTGAVLKMKDYSDHLQDLYDARTTSCGDFDVDFGYLTGIENSALSEFSVFPNPASDAVTVTTESSSGQVSVYNMKGQLVVQKAINSLITLMDISHLESGIYSLEYLNGDQYHQDKIVVQ